MGEAEIKLPLAIAQARLDLDGNGTADAQESLFGVFNATLAGGSMPPEAAQGFTVTFDRGDASWLRGYANLLGALLEFMLAHDGKASFDVSAHMLFPGASLPNAEFDKLPGTSGELWRAPSPISLQPSTSCTGNPQNLSA